MRGGRLDGSCVAAGTWAVKLAVEGERGHGVRVTLASEVWLAGLVEGVIKLTTSGGGWLVVVLVVLVKVSAWAGTVGGGGGGAF